MKLSPNFTLAEMARTGNTALAAQNLAEAKVYLPALTALCTNILEPIRLQFGPVSIHSGFRGPTLNKSVGGQLKSQHCLGEAADFHCEGAKLVDVFEWIASSKLPFGQLILEKRAGKDWSWIHVSNGPPWRDEKKSHQVLTFDGKDYAPYKKG